MQRKIIGFHQDEAQNWVADLACGHKQLYPGTDLRRKQDHGRAEAVLLAYWGQRHHAGGSTAGAVGRGQVADARRACSS